MIDIKIDKQKHYKTCCHRCGIVRKSCARAVEDEACFKNGCLKSSLAVALLSPSLTRVLLRKSNRRGEAWGKGGEEREEREGGGRWEDRRERWEEMRGGGGGGKREGGGGREMGERRGRRG